MGVHTNFLTTDLACQTGEHLNIFIHVLIQVQNYDGSLKTSVAQTHARKAGI